MVWSMNKAFLIRQPVENDIITYDNIWEIATDQGEDHTIECLLDYNYFIKHCSMIAIDLNKQQALDDVQIIEKAKETVLDFSPVNMRVLCIYFSLIYHYTM